jgi:hypothetical protein
VLCAHRIDVVPQRPEFGDQTLWQILVEFDVHRLMGNSASGKSS